jgi:hypothetical protein
MVHNQSENFQAGEQEAAGADDDTEPAPPTRETVDHEQDGEEDDRPEVVADRELGVARDRRVYIRAPVVLV